MRLILYMCLTCLFTLSFACTTQETTSPYETSPAPQEQSTARPSPEDRIPRITADELYSKYISGADILIVDARHKEEFETDHITGAISAPLEEILSGKWKFPEDLNKEIIFYCT